MYRLTINLMSEESICSPQGSVHPDVRCELVVALGFLKRPWTAEALEM